MEQEEEKRLLALSIREIEAYVGLDVEADHLPLVAGEAIGCKGGVKIPFRNTSCLMSDENVANVTLLAALVLKKVFEKLFIYSRHQVGLRIEVKLFKKMRGLVFQLQPNAPTVYALPYYKKNESRGKKT